MRKRRCRLTCIIYVFVSLMVLTCSKGQSTVTATIKNGFNTSAPLELGYVKVFLENSHSTAEKVTIYASRDWFEKEVDLPPNSRKIIPFTVQDRGEVDVRNGADLIARETVLYGMGTEVILVISERDTGLRFLGQATLSNNRKVEVIYTRPRDLPDSWYAYGSYNNSLIIIHPGGFDNMTAAQWDALLLRTQQDNTVLVSEGKPDAFKGTPLQDIIPGSIKGVDTFSEWNKYLSGAKAEPTALVNISPVGETSTPVGLQQDFRGVVCSQKGAHLLTYLGFDYTAPPFRTWDSSLFWRSQMGAVNVPYQMPSVSQNVLRIMTNYITWGEVQQLPFVLGAIVLLMSYIALVYGSKRFAATPGTVTRWLIAPALLLLIFFLAVVAGLLVRSNSARNYYEISVLESQDDKHFLRSGRIGLVGQGKLTNAKPASKRILMRAPKDLYLYYRPAFNVTDVKIEPGTPPTIKHMGLASHGFVDLSAVDIVDKAGELNIVAVRTAQGDYSIDLQNDTQFKLEKPRIYLEGGVALLPEIPAKSKRNFTSITHPIRPGSGGLTGEEALEEAMDAQFNVQAPVSNAANVPLAGVLVAEVKLPPLLKPAFRSRNYLVQNTIVK